MANHAGAAMSGDEGPDVCVPVESAPELDTIYAALVGKSAVRRRGNLSCSGNANDFCYLCAYCDQADSTGLLLKDHINTLVAQGKEVQQASRPPSARPRGPPPTAHPVLGAPRHGPPSPSPKVRAWGPGFCLCGFTVPHRRVLVVFQVAGAIQKIYNAELREYAVHERTTDAGQKITIEKPAWEVESIVRHLLLSSETEAVFETYQNQVYKSMILRQAERLVNVCVAPPRPSPGAPLGPGVQPCFRRYRADPFPSRDTGEVDASAAQGAAEHDAALRRPQGAGGQL